MSLYLPSGTNIDRLDHKFKFMDDFQNYIELKKANTKFDYLCGDYNICHEAIDIHDPHRKKCIWVYLKKDHGLTDL
jgi:exodeoxyribonuclease-3